MPNRWPNKYKKTCIYNIFTRSSICLAGFCCLNKGITLKILLDKSLPLRKMRESSLQNFFLSMLFFSLRESSVCVYGYRLYMYSMQRLTNYFILFFLSKVFPSFLLSFYHFGKLKCWSRGYGNICRL